MSEMTERTYNILVYGIEKKGLSAPEDTITERNYSLTFEPISTPRRFNEFDAVIIFKGVFESFEWNSSGYERYLKHSCNQDELDKRKKEAKLLMEQGGFICFLLDDVFIDSNDRRNFKGSDLAKYHLNYSNFYREAFGSRITHLEIKSDDFRPFLKLYGAANSHFNHYNSDIDWRVIAEASGRCAGMIINRNNYFLPSLIPDDRPEIIKEYFTILAEGLTASYNKLHITVPDWVKIFDFHEEEVLRQEKSELLDRINTIDERENTFNQFKSVLALAGDDLVESVALVFSDGLEIEVDSKDELREDFKLLGSDSDPICLCEVKGVNKGVKREHINQADSHRERSGFNENFPSILIANTHIKNSRSVEEKDQEIAKEQILHAVKMDILILRTIDLLGLARLFLNGNISKDDLIKLITENKGWLRIESENVRIIDGITANGNA
jgi:hypothetical protein